MTDRVTPPSDTTVTTVSRGSANNAGQDPQLLPPSGIDEGTLRFVTISRVFIEVVGDRPLPDEVDRDDVEDLLAVVLGPDGEATGAGVGASIWHLDVEISADEESLAPVVERLAVALVSHDLGWVTLRSEYGKTKTAARELVRGSR
jgi:hypothetical protein